jgi:hypothetical protein
LQNGHGNHALLPNCVCPNRDVFCIHLNAFFQTCIAESPVLYVHQILLSGKQGPATQPFRPGRRLEEPINRFRATAAFHGHAHNGAFERKTAIGIPVYKVSAPALGKTGKPYRIIEV